MDWNVLYYCIYGFFAGLSELMPVSASAHAYLTDLMTDLETMHPLLRMMCHGTCLFSVLLFFRSRIRHIIRETRIASQPIHRRRRQPDMTAVLDAKVILIGLIPMAIGILLSAVFYGRFAKLPVLSLILLISGIVLYIPPFLPGANKDSRSLSRKDGLVLGFWSAFGFIPGMSRVGTMIATGLMKGCDKQYISDLTMLMSVPALLGLVIVDLATLMAGNPAITSAMVGHFAVASVMTFAGAWLAMVIVRYITTKSNFYGFAYYNWGLALFSFLVYLMV